MLLSPSRPHYDYVGRLFRFLSPKLTPDTAFRMANSTLRGQPAIILVVVDASKALDFSPLIHALKYVVKPGEKLVLLGIIDHISTLLGYKKATAETGFNATNKRELAKEIKRVSQLFEKDLEPFSKVCDRRQVLLEYIIDTGASFSGVLLHRAAELQPQCLVLGRDLKRQKLSWAKNLTCDVLLMNKKGEARIVVSNPTSTHSS